MQQWATPRLPPLPAGAATAALCPVLKAATASRSVSGLPWALSVLLWWRFPGVQQRGRACLQAGWSPNAEAPSAGLRPARRALAAGDATPPRPGPPFPTLQGGLVSAFARSVAAHVKALMEPNARVWDPADAKVGGSNSSSSSCAAWRLCRGCARAELAATAGWLARRVSTGLGCLMPPASLPPASLWCGRTSCHAASQIQLTRRLLSPMLQAEREHEKRVRAEQEAKRQAERLAKARAREAAIAARLAAQAAAAAAPTAPQQQPGPASADDRTEAKPEAAVAAPAPAATPAAPPAPASTPVVQAAAAADGAAEADEDGGSRKRRRRGGGAVDYVALNKQLEAEAAARRAGGDAS